MASQWTSKDDVAKYRHILRWADLVQNTLVNVPEPIKIDYDIDIPREIKEKKKPAKEAEKSATPEPKVKATPDAAQGQRKELTEEEKKAKAAAKEAKKAAKAKANAEKNKQQQAPVATPPNPSMIDFRVGFIEKLKSIQTQTHCICQRLIWEMQRGLELSVQV